MRNVQTLVGAILLVGTIVLSACGGGGDDGNKATNTPGGQQQTTATPAKSTAATKSTEATKTPTATTGGGDGGNAAAEPCALLTKDEVQEVLGEDIADPVPIVVGSQQVGVGVDATVANCSYESQTTVQSVSINIWSAPGNDDGIGQLIDFVCMTKEKVSGVGDTACWYSTDHNELQLSSGANFLDLEATLSGDEAAALQTLAKKAVSRLP